MSKVNGTSKQKRPKWFGFTLTTDFGQTAYNRQQMGTEEYRNSEGVCCNFIIPANLHCC